MSNVRARSSTSKTRAGKDPLAAARDSFKIWLRATSIYDVNQNDVVPTVLRREQSELVEMLTPGRKVVVLKGRRIGITTVMLLRALWLVWREHYGRGRPIKCIIAAEKARKAEARLRDLADINTRLPPAIRIPWAVESAGQLAAPCGASILAMGTGGIASDTAARGEGAILIHLTEYAYYADQEATLDAFCAVMGQEGNLVVETTVRSPGDHYHHLVTRAERGQGPYTLAFFPWHRHSRHVNDDVPVSDLTAEETDVARASGLPMEEWPARMAWWRTTRSELSDRDAMGREYPTTIEDAFRISDGVFFGPSLVDPIRVIDVRSHDHAFDMTSKRRVCAMGVDVAKGTGGDESVISVVDAGTLEPVHLFHSDRITTRELATRVAEISVRYDRPICIVEVNSIGEAVWNRLQELGVGSLWVGPDGRPWTTTLQSKVLLYDHLRSILEAGRMAAIPRPVALQIRSLLCDPGEVAPHAPRGQLDDMAVAHALAVYAASRIPTARIVETEADRMLDSIRASNLRSRSTPWSHVGR